MTIPTFVKDQILTADELNDAFGETTANIVAETARAQAAETVLQGEIDTETDRATEAENMLADMISAESAALAATTGATLIGTSNGNNAQVELNLKPQQVASYAALRAVTTTTLPGTSANVIKYSTSVNVAPDGTGNLFVVDPSDTTSADNDVTIIVDSSGRRWKSQATQLALYNPLLAPGQSLRLMGSVFRQVTAGAGWNFLNDAGHVPINFSGAITVVAGKIVLPYGFTAKKVVSMNIAPDEGFGGLGVVAGASVGNSTATVSLYKNLDFAINFQTGAIVPSTYFPGAVSVVTTGGVSVITHPSCGSASVVPWITQGVAGYENRITSYTATTITVTTMVDFSGTITYNGSAFVCTTPCANVPTMSFNGTTGELTVTHETLPTAYAIPTVTDASGSTVLAKHQSNSATTTSFVIKFFDLATAGAPVILTPNTNMRATYIAAYKVTAAVALGSASIGRPNCFCDATNVSSAGANLWCQAEMVV